MERNLKRPCRTPHHIFSCCHSFSFLFEMWFNCWALSPITVCVCLKKYWNVRFHRRSHLISCRLIGWVSAKNTPFWKKHKLSSSGVFASKCSLFRASAWKIYSPCTYFNFQLNTISAIFHPDFPTDAVFDISPSGEKVLSRVFGVNLRHLYLFVEVTCAQWELFQSCDYKESWSMLK